MITILKREPSKDESNYKIRLVLRYYISCIISVLCFIKVDAQTSGVVWRKELLSNFDSTNTGIIFQGITTDSSNNIYFCQGLNGSDTTSSILSKYSPSGELLWRRTLLPNNQYQGIHTQFDYAAKIFIDQDEKLVFCSKGYEVSTGNVILLYKFDLNGNIISKAGLPILVSSLPNNFTHTQKEIIVENGNIYFPIYTEMIDSGRLQIYCFDKDFNHFSTKTFEFYKATHGKLVGVNQLKCSIQDNLLTIFTNDVNPDYTEIKCIDLNSNQTIINYSIDSYKNFHSMYHRGNFYLFLGGDGILKFDNVGSKIFEYYQSPCYGFNRDNDFLNFCKIYYTADFIPIPINTIYNRYNIYTDSIYSFSPSIPNVVSANSGIIERRGNELYSTGLIQDDTIKFYNGYKTSFYSKLDTLGNTIDYYLSSVTNLGWTIDGYVNCFDKENNIVAFQSLIKPADSTPAKIFNYIVKGSFYRISNLNGTCFYDENDDCTRDAGENAIANNIVHLLPEDIYTSTDSNGKYSFSKLDGNAKIEVTPINKSSLCDTIKSVECDDIVIYDNLDFGYKPIQELFCSSSIHNFVSRPGFYPRINCYVNNKNPVTIYDINFTVLLDSAFQYENSDLNPDSIVDHKLFFHLDSLKANDFKNIVIVTYLPQNIPLGYNFMHFIQTQITKAPFKCVSSDSTSGITVGSYDPNDKIVEPIGKGPGHFISNNTTLKYTIRFQNTGTDTAFNVRIFDDIDINLDLSTLQILANSHPVTFKLENRRAKFYFNNINLVDSNKSQILSNGFIEYSIKPNPNIDGQRIRNKAEIYFDYNTPVITNTTYSTIGEYVEPILIPPFNFSFYPNPYFNGEFTIQLDIEQKDKYSISFMDISGRVVDSIVSNKELTEGAHSMKINLSQLTAGMYFIRVNSKSNRNSISKKIIISP